MDYSTILQRIRPGPQEKAKLKSIIKEFLKKIKYKTILGGSGAKETWLANSHDIDIFVIFPKNVNDISDKLEVELKKSFKKVDRLHGSRDYFQVKYKGILFELVPIVEISKAEQALNITDISPLHSKWVNKHTKGKKDEILLLKQFCRAQGLYGAESHIAGFSGYIIEILVAHYSSFEKVLKSVIKWKNQEVIDISKYYPKNDVLFNLNTSKTQCPLIIVDPVDKTRNAAAAVSVEKYKLFQKLAKRFLKKPKEDFFLEKEFNIELLGKEAKRKKKALLVINLVPLSGKTDVVGMKLVKGRDFLLNKLEPFEVKKFGWDWKKEVDCSS